MTKVILKGVAMTTHACPRCGFESERARWWDRHPVAAVCAGVFVGLPALYTVAGVTLAYPWFAVPVLIVVCAVLVDRRMRQRAAIAARADWEHRQMIATAVFRQGSSRLREEPCSPRHVMNRWPTTPVPTVPIGRNR